MQKDWLIILMENKKKSFPLKVFLSITTGIIVGAILLLIGYKAYEKYSYFYKPYLYINERAVSRVEYDYYYHSYYNNYLSSYSFALAYMELDLTQDIEPQRYDENRTYGEYFKDCAVDQLIKITALNDDGIKNGFEYDSDSEYNDYLEQIKQACDNAGTNVDAYFKKFYGRYATEKSVGKYLRYGFYANAYYDYLCNSMNESETDSTAFDYTSRLKEDYEIKFEE